MDNKDHRHVFAAYMIVIEITGSLFTGCVANPQLGTHAQFVEFNESTPIGTTLFSLSAVDPVDHGNQLAFRTDGLLTAEYVSINQPNVTTPTTAWITLKKPLDRESYEGGIELKFSLIDSKGNTIPTTVQLYILDECDEDPRFNTLLYTTEINETEVKSPVVVYTAIHATDRDNGVNALVFYTMEPKAESPYWKERYMERFRINRDDGRLWLIQNLDYENNSFYQFTIHANDTCNRTALPADLIIRVKDVQDTPPFFTGLPYMNDIPEGSYTKRYVRQVTAFDGDRGIPNEILYFINKRSECTHNTSGGCSFCDTLFTIDKSSGEITITGNLDWAMEEVQNISGICTIIVEARENDNNTENRNKTSSTTVTVTIQDENNQIPMFERKSYNATVQENAAPNTALLLGEGATGIKVSDKDKQGIHSTFLVTLKCEGQAHCNTFEVVPSSPIIQEGVIIIRVVNNSLLDYEQRHNITITMVATEVENTSHSHTATVMVHILNENEFAPKFENTSYQAWIMEGPEANGTSVNNIKENVTVVKATDKDASSYGDVSYSLSGGNSFFSVNNETGQIVTNCRPGDLDRETLPKFYLFIIARDGGGLISQTQLIVNLLDRNDNPPIFAQDVYTAYLDENSTVYLNKSLLTVKATDADQKDTNNSEVSYEIRNISDLERNFTIDSKAGTIKLVSPLDYEALNDTLQGVITLTVFARDHGTPQLSSNVTVNISLQDVNDNAPSFNEKLYCGSIKETANNGTFVGKVNATDADKTERNKKISFAIEAGGFDNFQINSTTGIVTVQVGAHFDRDNMNLYNLKIIAIDHGENPFTTTTTMRITIEDVNNKPPKFNQSSYSVETLEDIKLGSNLTNCIADDLDINQSLRYSISGIKGWNENGGNVNKSLIENYFRIETGTVFVNACLDRETVEKLEVTIMVHDANEEENKPQTATTTLIVTLLDVNDNKPVFIYNEHTNYYETTVSENANNPTILMSVSATDKDKNRTITYGINDSTLNETVFTINPKTGEISKIGMVDREETPTVNLTVIATDDGYPSKSSRAEVLITILDFNDNTPQFLDHNETYHVFENVTIDTFIATINATDADIEGNGRVEYEIENAQTLPFKINKITGMITMSKRVDRENISEYRLTVVAKDNPDEKKLQRINQTSIVIVLDDINDNDPKFSDQILTTRTPENTAVGTEIFTVTATDADEGYNANVMFSIENETNVDGYFGITNTGNNEGRVFIAKSLDDSEAWRNITVIGTDQGVPHHSSNTTLHIAVLDVNLHAPMLGYVPEVRKVFECARTGTEIFRINATDKDKTSPNNEVHYNMSVIQPQNNKNIQINHTSGYVFVAADLNVANITSYKVQVMAVDQGTPNLTSSLKMIDILVDDVNDQPPHFVKNWFSFSVEEGQRNKAINQVVAFDPDKNSNSCYTLMDISSYRGHFTINKTGYIMVEEPLDRENESQQIITFEVKVYDCTEVVNVSEQCGNSYQLKYNTSDIANVTITVLDIDDNPPEFTKKNLRAGIRTKSEPGKEILELKSYVSDKDSPPNAIDKWFFENVSLTMEQKLASVLDGQKTGEVCKETLCVTGNGTIVNNMWYTQDMSGFFNLSVRVNDSAGNDTTYILIFLIADSQVLKMTILGNRTAVALIKNEILSECSNKTGLPFVYDTIADHVADDGSIESYKTDLFFHIDDPVNNRVLSAEEAKRLLDTYADKLIDVRINRNIISIESSLKSALPENESSKTIYVMAAVIGLLALVILIVGYIFFSSSNRYKRKLRAAMPMEKEMNVLTNTVPAVPGSNIYASSINPLLKAGPEPPEYREIDATSHNSLDQNEVDDSKQELPKYELEEREITLDMYAEDFNSTPAIDPLQAALREHDVQMKAAMSKQEASNESVNYGFLHQLDLETTEI